MFRESLEKEPNLFSHFRKRGQIFFWILEIFQMHLKNNFLLSCTFSTHLTIKSNVFMFVRLKLIMIHINKRILKTQTLNQKFVNTYWTRRQRSSFRSLDIRPTARTWLVLIYFIDSRKIRNTSDGLEI